MYLVYLNPNVHHPCHDASHCTTASSRATCKTAKQLLLFEDGTHAYIHANQNIHSESIVYALQHSTTESRHLVDRCLRMAVKAEAVDCFGVSEPVRNSGGDGEGEGKEGLFMLSLLGKEREIGEMGTLNGARAVAKRSTTDIEEDWVEVEGPPRRVGAVEEVERGGVKFQTLFFLLFPSHFNLRDPNSHHTTTKAAPDKRLKVPYLIPLAPSRAATTFEAIPCTDASHLSTPDGGTEGHRRCKFPKKAVLVDPATGGFAIVHAKGNGYAPGCKMLRPTAAMAEWFVEVGVKVDGGVGETLAGTTKEDSHQAEDDGWDLVGRGEAEEGYVLVSKK